MVEFGYIESGPGGNSPLLDPNMLKLIVPWNGAPVYLLSSLILFVYNLLFMLLMSLSSSNIF